MDTKSELYIMNKLRPVIRARHDVPQPYPGTEFLGEAADLLAPPPRFSRQNQKIGNEMQLGD
jgi:hypothetical protein